MECKDQNNYLKSREELDKEELDEISQKLVCLNKLISVFQDDDRYHKYYEKHQENFERVRVDIESVHVMIPTAFELLPYFDFENVRGNGYRSFFAILYRCLKALERNLKNYKSSYKISRSFHEHSFLEFSACLSQLTMVAKYLIQMMMAQKDRGSQSLFMDRSDNEELYRRVVDCCENMDCKVFYGQCLGFYLCDSCQALVKLLCSLQLGMGHAMTLQRSDLELFISTVVNGAQSFIQESKRAAQLTNLYKQATVTFCKQFWNLVDHPIVGNWAAFVLPHLAVNRDVYLQPVGLEFEQEHDKDRFIRISPPVAHKGHSVVYIRLLSSQIRKGMEWAGASPDEDAVQSDCLLFHCHGGGFVAQSSKSHDSYLRGWAISLNCPIVSVEYSHAPENPYPRAHEECFYAYCWVLRNLKELGCSTNCRVVLCGDSAGGNLALGVLLKAIHLDIPLPQAILLAYPATLVDFVPSPARMLGILDPILPLGVLARCLLAYGGVNEEYLQKSISSQNLKLTESSNDTNKWGDKDVQSSTAVSKKKDKFLEAATYDSSGAKLFSSRDSSVSAIALLESADLPNDPIISPLLADDESLSKFPPMTVIASQFDPLLDDSVELCKRVAAASSNGKVNLKIMQDLPHGFLNMASPVTKECYQAAGICLKELTELLAADKNDENQK